MGTVDWCFIKMKAFAALLTALAAVLTLAAACGDGEEEPSPSATEAATPTEVATPTPAGTPAFPFQFEGPIGIDLTTFGTFFEEGESIQLAITVAVREPTTLYYRTSQRYDLTVTDSDGQEVWRWSRDRAFAQVTEEVQLEAHDMLPFGETWDQRDNDGQQVPLGNYEITAESSHCDADFENCGQLTTSGIIQVRAP